MSTNSLTRAISLHDSYADVVSRITDADFASQLAKVDVNWDTGAIISAPTQVEEFLGSHDYLKAKNELNDRGVAFLGKLLVDFGALKPGCVVADKFEIVKTLAIGRNSAALLANHLLIGRPAVLKILRPGIAKDLAGSLNAVAQTKDDRYLVHPTDVLRIELPTLAGKPAQLTCLVFPFVDGLTLRQFLSQRTPLSPYFFASFIDQVATALASLETVGAYHGDLHGGNILVTTDSGGYLRFQIIDISFGMTAPSDYVSSLSDFQQFQHHLAASLSLLQRHLAAMSLRKHLRAKLYGIVEAILSSKTMRFAEVLALLKENHPYQRFVEQRDRFIAAKFAEPQPMSLLRYEEITKPDVAVGLFEPYEELLTKLKGFGNAILFGHRGSGKSTYLAALAFFPSAEPRIVDPRQIFGVFFACRQGEFKQFSSDQISYDAASTPKIKHVFVLKIIRRIVSALDEAISRDVLSDITDYKSIYAFLGRLVAEQSLGPFDRSHVAPLQNLHAALLRNEMTLIAELFAGRPSSIEEFGTERTLIDFCSIVRSSISDLANTRFYFLFDDAGKPNVPVHAQRVLNDLLVCSNPIYCVKLSAERFAYSFEDSTGKALEDGHDYATWDISNVLFLGGGKSIQRPELERYFKKIIARRLERWNFRSNEITDYLGEELIPIDELVTRLARAQRNAYYAGWSVVWQLADRTTRNLLEMVSNIFAEAKVTASDAPIVIPPSVQDRAVRALSERKLKGLSYIPGKFNHAGEDISLGRRLYLFTASLGSVFRLYLAHHELRSRARTGARLSETLAIERNDSQPMRIDAESFLEYLIRFGILDDTKLTESRDDRLKKPIYILNRIYCPVFGISFRRDTHLRLSRAKFEELLLSPAEFRKRGTHLLSQLSGEPETHDLFRHI